MSARNALIKQLQDGQYLFETFAKDFSEEDARFQPFEGGNHFNWILMHLAVSADSMISTLTGDPKQLSDAVHEKYQGGRPCRPDDGVTKADAWKMFVEQHARTIECVKSFPEERYDEPNPNDSQMFPTLGSVVAVMAIHPIWHFGQLTVNRRMLGKPMIFPQS